MSDSTATSIWVIDDDQSIRWVLERALTNVGFAVSTFETASSALTQLKRSDNGDIPGAILCDLRMPGISGFEFLKQVKNVDPSIPIIIMTAYSDLDTTVEAYQQGAFEYLAKPFDIDQAIDLISRACEKHSESPAVIQTSALTDEIIGESIAIQEVFRVIGRLSRSHASVLISGESGTGKELVARAIHRHSPRKNGPFIAINTAAIPAELLESELFGHEKGAFTGAHSQYHGRFEQANEGTLFLDEIGDMPTGLQTRLLRVLAEGEFFRVGGSKAIRTNVRIITATHRNLGQLVEQNLFREDLFHRLNVILLKLPPLRERREDIPLLLRHFLHHLAAELNEEPKQINPELMDTLCKLDWNGNIRQLENTCRWFNVMATGVQIQMSDLPDELLGKDQSHSNEVETTDNWEDVLRVWASQQLAAGRQNLLSEATPRFEKTLLECALESTGGRKQEAAKLLGWGRNTLTRKLKELY
ncbi:MAG: nitrogen regulation protein NR(I) [Proteobacteria bacterium]|nr:nitrogen regulation protein NR(I) [Pseudomonadota bacterium]